MGPHNKGRLPQDNAFKGQTPNQNRPTPTKPKPPPDLENHSIPPLKGQMGPAGSRQRKVEGGNLKPTRPTTLPGRNWKNVMQELQQLKKVRLGQDADQELENNPLSLAIQSDPISPAIRIPKEKFD